MLNLLYFESAEDIYWVFFFSRGGKKNILILLKFSFENQEVICPRYLFNFIPIVIKEPNHLQRYLLTRTKFEIILVKFTFDIVYQKNTRIYKFKVLK